MTAPFRPNQSLPWGMTGSARRAAFELVVSARFNAHNIPETIPPMVTFSVVGWHSLQSPGSDLPLILASGFVYSWMFLYIHTLSNQATGAAEDAVNKPFRPIPARLVTVRGAHLRFVPAVAVFLTLGWLNHALWSALGWAVAVTLHNYCGGDRHWLGRQAFNMAAVPLGFSASWLIAGPLTEDAWRYIGAICALLTLIFIQDLRDVAGDARVHRRTLPLVLGEGPTRALAAAMLVAFPCAAWSFLPTDRYLWHTGPIWTGVFICVFAWIALRLVIRRTPSDDHWAYRTYLTFGQIWLIAGLALLQR
ncbi:UbiA family prenyltransferase [Streptomyces xanthochromogenes]|uniref:UbiA family prenyltransferase n=1 Tax=Streptomyces xanthochromogenes TaxID=67384 RepID=UPI0037F675B9